MEDEGARILSKESWTAAESNVMAAWIFFASVSVLVELVKLSGSSRPRSQHHDVVVMTFATVRFLWLHGFANS